MFSSNSFSQQQTDRFQRSQARGWGQCTTKETSYGLYPGTRVGTQEPVCPHSNRPIGTSPKTEKQVSTHCQNKGSVWPILGEKPMREKRPCDCLIVGTNWLPSLIQITDFVIPNKFRSILVFIYRIICVTSTSASLLGRKKKKHPKLQIL